MLGGLVSLTVLSPSSTVDSMNILEPEDEEHTQEEDSSGSNDEEDSQDEEEEEEEEEEEDQVRKSLKTLEGVFFLCVFSYLV